MIPSQRHLFDIPDDVAYLNCATLGPMPKAAVQAGTDGLARKAQPWTMQSQDFFKDTVSLRPKLAKLVNSEAADIAFVPSVSYGLATAARNISLSQDQDILILADQFPSNVYTWRTLAAHTGATLNTVDAPAGSNTSPGEAFLNAIRPETGLVACAQVRWTDGTLLDLEAIGARCREVGAALVLDLTQSCGAMAFDVARVQPDFVVVAGYKWLLGPYAAGFLYVAPRHQTGQPLEQGWIGREGSTDFTRLTNYQEAFNPGAERFDMGERSNFALLPALERAVDLLLDWEIDNIEATLGAHNRRLAARLAEIGLQCPDERLRGPHYLGARLPETAPEDIIDRLQAQGVHISKRGSSLRITQHLYNTEADEDRLIAALKDLL